MLVQRVKHASVTIDGRLHSRTGAGLLVFVGVGLEDTSEDIVDNMVQSEHIRRMYTFIEKVLTQREKDIIYMRYGLYGNKEKTQREIAEQMGISRSYVSRIEKKALSKLRQCF